VVGPLLFFGLVTCRVSVRVEIFEFGPVASVTFDQAFLFEVAEVFEDDVCSNAERVC